jgi:uncharacterized protein YjbI with pentapeptide repeats
MTDGGTGLGLMADKVHLEILGAGVEVWNSWRESILRKDAAAACGIGSFSEEKDRFPDLEGADLRYYSLRHVDLSNVNLSGSNLLGAHMSFADLRGASLRGAFLYGADLANAMLWNTDLTDADLRRAHLYGAEFREAQLVGTRFEGAILGRTIIAASDISSSAGLDRAEHAAASTIGVDTLYKSKGKVSAEFLFSAGVPGHFAEYLPSLVGERPLQYYSCFISHSTKDRAFCDRFCADLRSQGVRCWYFPEDAAFGRGVWAEIDRGIKIFDKMILVCSINSLRSGPVMREVHRALAREDEEGRDVLFPVRLDNHVFSPKWDHPLKQDISARVVGDFSGYVQDDARYDSKYRDSFRRLMSALGASE